MTAQRAKDIDSVTLPCVEELKILCRQGRFHEVSPKVRKDLILDLRSWQDHLDRETKKIPNSFRADWDAMFARSILDVQWALQILSDTQGETDAVIS